MKDSKRIISCLLCLVMLFGIAGNGAGWAESNTMNPYQFNEDIYRANWFLYDSIAAGYRNELSLESPSQTYVRLLNDTSFDAALAIYDTLNNISSFLDNITTAYDKSSERKDIYLALLFNALEASSDYHFLDNKLTQELKNEKPFLSYVSSGMKSIWDIEINEANDYASMTDAQKSTFSSLSNEWFSAFHPVASTSKEVISALSTVFDICENAEDYYNYLVNCATLYETSDSLKNAIWQMYQDSISIANPDLSNALKECYDVINGNLNTIGFQSAVIAGRKSAEYLLGELWWDTVKKDLYAIHPEVAILQLIFKGEKIILNQFVDMDETRKTYLEMNAISQIEILADKTFSRLSTELQQNQTTELAQTLLCQLDIIYRLRIDDCEKAISFKNVADYNLIDQIQSLVFGENRDLQNRINEIKEQYELGYSLIHRQWVYQLKNDYPNAGLFELYLYLLDEESRVAYFNTPQSQEITSSAINSADISLYVPAVEETIAYASSTEEIYVPFGGWGMLYDIDSDGFEELVTLTYAYYRNQLRVYDAENGTCKRVFEYDIDNVIAINAGGDFSVGVAEYQGTPTFFTYIKGPKFDVPSSTYVTYAELLLYTPVFSEQGDVMTLVPVASFYGDRCDDVMGELKVLQVLRSAIVWGSVGGDQITLPELLESLKVASADNSASAETPAVNHGPLGEDALLAIMENAAGQPMEDHLYLDMDHDGANELIGVCHDASWTWYTWYCSSDGSVVELVQEDKSAIYYSVYSLDVATETHIVIGASYGETDAGISSIFTLKNGDPFLVSRLSGHVYVDESGNIALRDNYLDSENGRTEIISYLYYDGETYRKYELAAETQTPVTGSLVDSSEVTVFFEHEDYQLESAQIKAYDSNGNVLWTYITDKYDLTQLNRVTEIGIYRDCYYFNEDGSIVVLNLATGAMLWRNYDYVGSTAGFCFDGTGTLYLCGYLGPDFYAVDWNGNTLCRIEHFDAPFDSSIGVYSPNYYWADSIQLWGDHYVAVELTAGPDGYRDPGRGYIFYIDLNDYSYSMTMPGTTTTTSVAQFDSSKITVSFDVLSDHAGGGWLEYAQIAAFDAEGNIIWNYKTESYDAAELPSVAEIGIYQDRFYFLEEGSIVALDLQTGEVLWRNTDFLGSNAPLIYRENEWFYFGEGGILYLCGKYSPDFFAVDWAGNTLCRIDRFDARYWWANVIRPWGDHYLTVEMAFSPDANWKPGDVIFYIDLNDYSYSMTMPGTTTTTPIAPSFPSSAVTIAPAPGTGTSGSNPFANLRVGRTVTFGSYEQDNNFGNGTEAIEWIVLDVQNGSALLLSKYCLDCIEYNDVNRGWQPWANSLVREWLNGDFYRTAFSSSEREYIQSTYNVNRNNPEFGTRGGDDTWDTVFLLSLDEAEAYTSREQRKARPTAYTRSLGVEMNDQNGCAWWWLRSPGEAESNAALVWSSGKIEVPGIYFSYGACGVRPAIWVNTGK